MAELFKAYPLPILVSRNCVFISVGLGELGGGASGAAALRFPIFSRRRRCSFHRVYLPFKVRYFLIRNGRRGLARGGTGAKAAKIESFPYSFPGTFAASTPGGTDNTL